MMKIQRIFAVTYRGNEDIENVLKIIALYEISDNFWVRNLLNTQLGYD